MIKGKRFWGSPGGMERELEKRAKKSGSWLGEQRTTNRAMDGKRQKRNWKRMSLKVSG